MQGRKQFTDHDDVASQHTECGNTVGIHMGRAIGELAIRGGHVGLRIIPI